MDSNFEQRLATIERHLRNMRMAVIVVVAFFLYESLMPDELRPGNRDIQDVVKTRELILLDSNGETLARLKADSDNQQTTEYAELILSDSVGNRMAISSDALRLFTRQHIDTIERLSIAPNKIMMYNESGTPTHQLP